MVGKWKEWEFRFWITVFFFAEHELINLSVEFSSRRSFQPFIFYSSKICKYEYATSFPIFIYRTDYINEKKTLSLNAVFCCPSSIFVNLIISLPQRECCCLSDGNNKIKWRGWTNNIFLSGSSDTVSGFYIKPCMAGTKNDIYYKTLDTL